MPSSFPSETASETVYIRVVLNVRVRDGLFDYSIPAKELERISPGCLVAVPFQQELMLGVVWETNVRPDVGGASIRPIGHVIDAVPALTAAQLRLATILAERCLAPLNECVNLLLTEKIRKLSQTIYRLANYQRETAVTQISFFPEDEKVPLREQILDLFKEKSAALTITDLERAFGKTRWRGPMEQLINKGFVEKETIFDVNLTGKPRLIRVARLSSAEPGGTTEWEKLSRDVAVHDRRRRILELLLENSDGLPVPEVNRRLGSIPGDWHALQKKGLISIAEEEIWRDYEPAFQEEYPDRRIVLNAEQAEALAQIQAERMKPGEKQPILLHGVTGSGKTELYLQAAAQALADGKQVLILVPEISLTPQMLHRFRSRFPGITGIYHSRLSDGERYDTWRRGRSGEFRVIVGPRSALAVPLPDLGLIVVDECHDDSFYQTEGMPFFSAVQAAADYAKITNALLILGSATPTTAQMFKAEHSGWQIIRLKQRATGVTPPQIRIIDMRQELKAGNRSALSRPLAEELERTFSLGKQSILFLNRRGAANYTFCHFCGFEFQCPRCDIPLTWHNAERTLRCHFCGFSQPVPAKCPQCGHHEIRSFGIGLERVEEILHTEFPAARILRMDAETTARKGDYERLLTAFSQHEADILIGTQMVAKGLDFPDVRLVGMILADVGTNFHDYRVDEHTYQMLTQVAGRAGRAAEQGLAILQTFQPDRYSIRAVAAGDFDAFYRQELRYRKRIGYPPFARMVRLEVTHVKNERAEAGAIALSEKIRDVLQAKNYNSIRMIGPAPCFFPRVNGKYRWHLILRGADPAAVVREIDRSGVRVEVDPPSLL